MNIYLKEASNKLSTFQFPSLPESIRITGAANYMEYDIIGTGTFAFPSGFDVRYFRWEGYMWGKSRRNDGTINSKWMAPAACIKKLKTWMEKGTVLNLIISGGGINKDVTISSLEEEQFGGQGDYRYSIELAIYRPLNIQTTKDLGIDNKKKKTTDRSDLKKEETDVKKKTHTVGVYDTLWSIARKYYGGDGSEWEKIYDANKTVIEETAKKYGKRDSDKGHWIYTGTILTIP